MSGCYEPYPEYKESGVEWLGEIPSHWDVRKLKFLASVKASNVDKKIKEGELPVSLCNYTDVYYNEVIDRSIEFMKATATKEQIERFTLRSGDTIITKDSEDPNDIAIPAYIKNNLPGVICGYHLSLISPGHLAYGLFIKRFFECANAKGYFATRANGLTRYGLSSHALDNVCMTLPVIKEQEQIATFLDYETAKIDALIAKQERLIELLEEKRQAVISHAVTKGLNPDVPMKPSGIEWLGDIPAHWKTLRLKFVSCFITSGPRGWAEQITDEGALFVQSGDLNESLEVEFTKSKRVKVKNNAETERTRLKNNDVIICITGAKTGNVAVCSCIPEVAHVNQHLCLVRPNGVIISRFLGLLLKSFVGQTNFTLNQYGLKQGLSLENIGEAIVLLPTQSEQWEIVEFLDSSIINYEKIIESNKHAVKLLQEKRTALISAAVTGKIDVRDWRPPAETASEVESLQEVP